MKNFIYSICLILGAALLTSLLGQPPPSAKPATQPPPRPNPPSNPRDNLLVRTAGFEMLRREAERADAERFGRINTEIITKFPEIKEDFEAIQILEAAIIKGYTTGKTIDYNLVEISANEINRHAKRLDSNLFFAETEKEKKERKSAAKKENTRGIKNLIIDLDNAIGSFVSSQIFGNLKVIEPEVAVSTRNDLFKIRTLSQKLAAEAKKLK